MSNASAKNSIFGTGLVVLDIIIDKDPMKPVFSAGGTCGNVVAGLSFLGWKSKIISRAGRGVASDLLAEDLLENGVDIKYIHREKKIETPRLIEKLVTGGTYPKHRFYLRCPACRRFLPRFRSSRLDFIDNILIHEKNPGVFFFDRITPSSLKMARVYRDRGALIFFEPNNLKHPDELEKAVRLCHILKFSNNVPCHNSLEDYTAAFLERVKSFQPPFMIRTLGDAGVTINGAQDDIWHHKKGWKLQRAVDTCGAGDWFTVGFLYYLQKSAVQHSTSLVETLHHPETIEASLDFGQVLAAISCMFVGARGLSKALTATEILEMVDLYIDRKPQTISSVRTPKHSRKQHTRNLEKKEPIANRCTTCLLNI
ncbi:MAG: hypothetical protein KAW12_18385 [Candidatus Aminicenantes bacterium]|nr:hypothetical protein [Candidatus Aminicenantes bacterium]